ncbi:D-alanine--poly(phosphoribitol) ligase [Spongiactinospora rosea]|uniref:D-alanine--poly(Phosphoribitol) ligase n=1 Tax=Spongiactinospora rosea TaxID=2248750 RepID=A0A366M525_9ACTN|nr:AMP-binding protein [Spongiactinospora rosea]RBQ20840.1 D-alanine--poly(phosphoribitol) ligase [Spongiactinospora rosea]
MNALHERFLRGLALAPDRVAVRVGADAITYRELHARALLRAGALPPTTVGVLAAKSVDAYAGILAALYAGATVVPLHAGFPVARLAGMVAQSGVTALVTDEAGAAVLPALKALAPQVYAPEPERPLPEPRGADLSDVAYILFTSGSTGRPKGVPITHGGTAHYFGLLDDRYDFTPADVFSQTFDLNFDCAMFDVFCAWGAGGSVVAVPPQAYRRMPEFVAGQGLSVWFSTPSAIALVRRTGGLSPGSMPELRWSFFAGEALTCADAADWQAAAPQSTLENLYGPTELTVTISAHRWAGEESARLSVNGVVPIGTIHDGHDHLIVDGELCVAGPQLTPGYVDPADDEGRFLSRDGRRWYRTGDRVRELPGGTLLYLGRLDGQVQVHGLRVELAEIDHALRGCAGVTDAVTVGVTNGGGVELVAFYTGTPSSTARLAEQLGRVLPAGMIPRRFRHLDDLPLNHNRKVDKGELRGLAATLLRG